MLYVNTKILFRPSYARKNYEGMLKHISPEGAFIETNLPKSTKKLSITLSVANYQRKIDAEIMEHGPKGLNIKFTSLGNKDIQMIDDFMFFEKHNKKSKKNLLHYLLQKL